MNQNDFDLVRRIVLETASKLQDGNPATAEDWFDIADELTRARDLARGEGTRLDAIEHPRG